MLKIKPKKQQKTMQEVFLLYEEFIRFPFISAELLQNRIIPQGIVSEKFLQEAFIYQASATKSSSIEGNRVTPRYYKCLY